MVDPSSDSSVELKRAIGLPLLVFYGVGTIVGGGFYALIGEVAGDAGMLAPFSFLVSAAIALITAFSFAELSARYPVSAGEARYVKEAFGSATLSTIVGWLVIFTGIVSAATLANAFAGFLDELIQLPDWISIALIVAVLGWIAYWGIGESLMAAAVITLIEVGGLMVILFYAFPTIEDLQLHGAELIPDANAMKWSGILTGAYLAFYSFIGFEDMVNVAEEVKAPRRNMPRAILISVAVTGLIYVIVCLAVVLAVPPLELAGSKSPFSLVLANHPFAAKSMAVVGMLAGVNGAMIQIIMASRVAFGLSKTGQGLAFFSKISTSRRTPANATLVVTIAVLIFALWLPITDLAKITSTVLLVVFSLVNASLWRLKLAKAPAAEGVPEYPVWIPFAGMLICLAFVVFNLFQF